MSISSLAQRQIDRPPADMGALLVQQGLISAPELAALRRRLARQRVRLSDALRIACGICPGRIAAAEAEIAGTSVIDPLRARPDPRLAHLPLAAFLRRGLLPWRRVGGCTVVLSARPEEFARHRDWLGAQLGPVRMAVTREDHLHEAARRMGARQLIAAAEQRVPAGESCRAWNVPRFRRRAGALLLALGALGISAPALLMLALATFSVLVLALFSAFRLAAGLVSLRVRPATDPAVPAALPRISILVPLFKEREIARHLVARLARLDYPRELLDICLVLEEEDRVTRAALERAALPRWCRTVIVPPGALQTKPRALNYALNFAAGSIIGVYDAEDAPAPDQLRRVVAHFAQRDRRVACLQGVLDYYNYDSNWLARCFTLEYASWFRISLPGLARMGLVVPLGGTTLFFRRDVLEEIGGWDAHNVTEDADLGLRLARHGYRTELIETVTEEEANCRLKPWIKQRSRWLKGYAITYAVHMRAPRRLWRDLGAWRFLGVQLIFFGTLCQFTLAPVLWSFWLLALGLPHPLSGVMPTALALTLAGAFLFSWAIDLAIAALAMRKAGRPRLAWWAPTLQLYFPLATLAVYKGLWELATRPFYWDKTAHGIFAAPETAPAALTPPPRPRAHPASAG